MANFTRIRDPGFWILASVVLPEEFEALDAARPKLINVQEGSTHAVTGDTTIGGSGTFRLSGNSRLDSITIATLSGTGLLTVISGSEVRVASGGLVNVQAGGLLKLNGALAEIRGESGSVVNLKAGSALDVKGGCTFYENSLTTFNAASIVTQSSGATWSLNGDVRLNNDNWPLLNSRAWERHSLSIAATTSGTQASKRPSNLAGGVDMVKIENASAAGDVTVIEFIDLPDGGTLASIDVSTQGTSNASGMTLPSYQIIRWKGTSPADAMSIVTADVHTDFNDFIATLKTTPVAVNANAVIDKSYRYGVRINHGFYGGAPSGGMNVYDAKASGTATRIGL